MLIARYLCLTRAPPSPRLEGESTLKGRVIADTRGRDAPLATAADARRDGQALSGHRTRRDALPRSRATRELPPPCSRQPGQNRIASRPQLSVSSRKTRVWGTLKGDDAEPSRRCRYRCSCEERSRRERSLPPRGVGVAAWAERVFERSTTPRHLRKRITEGEGAPAKAAPTNSAITSRSIITTGHSNAARSHSE